MATDKQLLNLKKCKNKFQHQWQDKGKEQGIELYTYTCLKCGAEKTKMSAYSAVYHAKDSLVTLYKAPDCLPTL